MNTFKLLFILCIVWIIGAVILRFVFPSFWKRHSITTNIFLSPLVGVGGFYFVMVYIGIFFKHGLPSIVAGISIILLIIAFRLRSYRVKQKSLPKPPDREIG